MAESVKLSDNALQVLERRYLARDAEGNLLESPEDMFHRVAKAVAAADAGRATEKEVAETERIFFEMMRNLEFLPNSPTLMNAGRPLGQLSACFVLPVGDSMEEIFEAVKQAALIHKSGGGTGFAFSRLRPNGAMVQSTGGIASGPVSFMKVFNAATEAVKQGGTRRGANMGVLRVDHPDILSFIACKHDNMDLVNFNLSVGVTEAFMKAVGENGTYDLVDPHEKRVTARQPARNVFDALVDSAWRNGEPGILFLDRINQENPTPALGEIESTNPCGELPLLPYEACNLGSINLSLLVKRNGKRIGVDLPRLTRIVHQAVHFLDNVIDVNRYPLPEIDAMTRSTRKIGLGIMGWADLLLQLGIPYDSEKAEALARKVMAHLQRESREASRKLAEARGVFPCWKDSVFGREGIPMRNATTTTIAPTGTLSMIAGVSGGVEPLFAVAYVKRVMDGTELFETNPHFREVAEAGGFASEALMKAVAESGSVQAMEEIPEAIRRVFVTAHDISPEWHVRMQAAFQAFTDNAVSKTVNLAHDATEEEVRDVFLQAWRLGCKGITIYRDGSRGGQVLNAGTGKTAGGTTPHGPSNGGAPSERVGGTAPHGTSKGGAASERAGGTIAHGTSGVTRTDTGKAHVQPRPRPELTTGFTEKVKIGCGNLYITVNYDEKGICEVFTNTGRDGGCPSQSEATARLISIALRSGVEESAIVSQLKGIRCPATIRRKGLKVLSCPDAIGRLIEKVSAHRNGEGIVMPEGNVPAPSPANPMAESLAAPLQETGGGDLACPECGAQMTHEGGCRICRHCGFSKCG